MCVWGAFLYIVSPLYIIPHPSCLILAQSSPNPTMAISVQPKSFHHFWGHNLNVPLQFACIPFSLSLSLIKLEVKWMHAG